MKEKMPKSRLNLKRKQTDSIEEHTHFVANESCDEKSILK